MYVYVRGSLFFFSFWYVHVCVFERQEKREREAREAREEEEEEAREEEEGEGGEDPVKGTD